MEVYLVGGAVRDRLLGCPVRERDWVVIGATPDDLVGAGYKPVGKSFPVFLHPETGEEYALARTERNTGPGYHGFAVQAGPGVSLKQDLMRRDLTVNALAEDKDGNVIDYYGGLRDLEDRCLRHVSPAFVEDPVRLLRVARFKARYCDLGFEVANETLSLMREMVASGEVDALVPERVWQELVGALAEQTPSEFFEQLRACGALRVLFPEIDALWGVPQPAQYHPEIDTGVHTMRTLDQSARLSGDPKVRFAALTHDLGKGTTPPDEWPSHHGHEARGAGLVNDLCQRLRAPKAFRELAVLVARYHLHCHRAAELRPGTLLDMLESLDALRRPERFEQFLLACEADFRGCQGNEESAYPQAQIMRLALGAIKSVNPASLVGEGISGEALGRVLRERRREALRRNRQRRGQGTGGAT